jgi:dolichyl-phosphate-mannose-protein mannosyltransferase
VTGDGVWPTADERGLRRPEWLALGAGVALAVTIRVLLLPQPGLAGDVDDFLAWVRAIAADGLGRAYDEPISFPPVLPWIWWLLGAVAPGILDSTPNDPGALVLLKLPATLADVGIAAIVGWALHARGHRGWAIAGILAILLHPAIWYVSALWGQFESVYVLPILVAWLLLTRNRPAWAAVAIAVGLMTKPQALPFVIPFAAYYLRQFGLAGSVRAVVVATATAALLWAPFVAAGGLAAYARNLGAYAAEFAVLSLRAWNPWWILQEALAGDGFVVDTVPILGPLTFRWLGVGLAGLLGLAVFAYVWRRPTASGLAWGLSAAALAAFIGLTTMHERYSYPVLVFLVLVWPDRLAIWTWLVASIAVTLNLVAAIPPSGGPGALVPVNGPLGIAGSAAMVATFVALLAGLRGRAGPEADPGRDGAAAKTPPWSTSDAR